jgi:hypothetical protein
MTISQPSPDLLIFIPHHRSSRLLRFVSWIEILVFSIRTTWRFDRKSQVINIDRRWAMLNFVKTIELCEIESIDIKRESFALVDINREIILLTSINGKLLHNFNRDRYSLVITIADGASFKCENNYLRIFTSTNLATVREFADLVRSHLNPSDRAMSELPNCKSSTVGLTPIKF